MFETERGRVEKEKERERGRKRGGGGGRRDRRDKKRQLIHIEKEGIQIRDINILYIGRRT